MIDPLKHRFTTPRGRAEFHSLRYAQRSGEYLSVCRNISEPPHFGQNRDAMLCVRLNGVEAYVATNDLSAADLQTTLEQAERQAERIARHALLGVHGLPPVSGRSQCRSPNRNVPFPSLAECYELLAEESAKVPRDERLVNWSVFLEVSRQEQLYLNSAGAGQYHEQRFVYPGAGVTAYGGRDSRTRSFGDHHADQQGGAEVIECPDLVGAAPHIADQALQLLAAPDTPSGRCDLPLIPDQVILQIHGSINHPPELDRILGDERNCVGTSFTGTEDFGRCQHGSSLFNVSFGPEIPKKLASHRQDDDGSPTREEYPVRGGRLLRPLSGALSQHRSGLEGVANSHASSQNHTPIDHMANLNLEPGDKSFAQLVGGIKRRMLMSHNRSQSIDGACNKFQFGCEWDRLIEDDELEGVVKNSNYRGISAQFWRNLSAVGDAGTFKMLGTPCCGKDRPNQVIRVDHASPVCIFGDVDVFGGGA